MVADSTLTTQADWKGKYMEDLIIPADLVQQKMKEALPKILEDIFSSSYSSPLRKVIDEELKSQDGVIKTVVSEIFTKALRDPKFKEQIGQVVLVKIVEKGLTN